MTASDRITIRVPREIRLALEAHCESHGLSTADAVNSLLASVFGVSFVPGRQRTGLAGADEATRRHVVQSQGRNRPHNKAARRQ